MTKAFSFIEAFSKGEINLEVLNNLVDFLLDFVVEPEKREEAKEQMLDASQDQFMEMLEAITGGGNTVPNAKSEP
jgi:hypothetical protein